MQSDICQSAICGRVGLLIMWVMSGAGSCTQADLATSRRVWQREATFPVLLRLTRPIPTPQPPPKTGLEASHQGELNLCRLCNFFVQILLCNRAGNPVQYPGHTHTHQHQVSAGITLSTLNEQMWCSPSIYRLSIIHPWLEWSSLSSPGSEVRVTPCR